MDEKLKYRLNICVIHFVLYLVILIIPWMFGFEMLPIPYGTISIFTEVSLYILWSIILIFSILQIKRDIKNYTFEEADETVSKRMWKVTFTIMRVLLLLTLAYLILTLIFIGISYIV
ncbi:MAG: hypothetical protein WCD89_12275 [Anaerocolumna sp.]